ncbi:integrase [Variovorax sp. PAMC 28711]|nr:integrase [Variovorax sp. PAMC 28711]
MQHFLARTQKSGRVYYYFDAGGKPRKEIPLGSDYISAVRKWAELKAQHEVAAAVTTFPELAARYEREVLPNLAKSSQITYKADLKHLRAFFGNPPAPLDSIRPKHIDALLQWKKDHPTTATRLKRLFSVMFNLARKWDYTNNANPCAGIKGFTAPKREVYITDAIFRAVWEQATAPLRDAMDLAYLTGQRPGDVLEMTERHIVDGMLEVKQHKTKTRRRIRIEGELATVIQRIKTRKEGYKVWSANLTVNLRGLRLAKKTMREMFVTARAKAADANPELREAIEAFWFYDLRAKAADDVADEHDDQTASNLLGHGSVAITTRHYLRKGKIVAPTR